MNQRIKANWCSALKSGEYKQGIGQLYDPIDNKFCCLGVLADLYIKETKGGRWDDFNFINDLEREPLSLPKCVVAWAELTDESPNAADRNLMVCNDKGVPFSEIASLIENSSL